MSDKLILLTWHWQLGWLRRPEMDDENGYCYEEPDGDLVFTPDPRHRKAARLAIWRQSNGTLYSTFSKAPAPKHKLLR